MSEEKLYDVIIIGGGIGGSCAAISLAQSGAKVLVLESGEFPRHKVCGEFLSSESKGVFSRLGVKEELQNAGATEVHSARIVARGGAVLDLSLPQRAFALSRFQLDAILVQAAQNAGARVLTRTRARSIEEGMGEENVGGLRVLTARGEFSARAVVNAAGRNSAYLQRVPENGSQSTLEQRAPSQNNTSKYIGLKTHFVGDEFPLGWVELHVWRGGYCGLVQVEKGILNVCLLARYESLAGRSPQEFWKWLQENLPALGARMKNAAIQMPWHATGNISFGAKNPITEKIWNCGDAASFIHPLAGDGMAMAARSGELLAAILKAQLRGDINEDIAREVYAAAWKREFSSRLHWAARFQNILLDSQLTTPLFTVLARVPKWAQLTVRATRE